MKQLLVSFVIPVLNAEKDIGRCLTSIRNQCLPVAQYEVLVVDNGSTDKTQRIVCDMGFHPDVIPGVTVSALRNHGARLARGNYLAFVDSDVEIASTWLREGLAVFESNSIVAAGCFPRAPRPATWVQQAWEMHQCGNQECDSKTPVSWLPSMNLLVRRDIFLAIHGFNEQLVTAEDVDLCYRLGQHGTILSVPAMEAIHWGEAANLAAFWRKEVWRGRGSLAGVLTHGLTWRELPSVGYPIYVLCLLLLLGASCLISLRSSQPMFVLTNLTLLGLPAFVLATRTSCRTQRFRALPQLFILYFVYGAARAYSLVKGSRETLRHWLRM